MTTAPRVEVFIQLVCDSYMPDATAGEGTPSLLMGDSGLYPSICELKALLNCLSIR